MPSTKIAQMVLLHRIKKATRALEKKYLKTISPEPLVQIQNNLLELFLMIPSTRIAQMVPLCRTKGLPEL